MKKGMQILFFAGCAVGFATAQETTQSVSKTYAGCVTATPDDPNSFVLAQEGSCSLLSGKLASRRLAGHIVELHGQFLDATQTDPQTIVIDGVDAVGPVCKETCTLEPPGHRGLRKKPKAGSPGATPGL